MAGFVALVIHAPFEPLAHPLKGVDVRQERRTPPLELRQTLLLGQAAAVTDAHARPDERRDVSDDGGNP
jgi:hypothetical protein